VVEHWTSKHEDLSSNPITAKKIQGRQGGEAFLPPWSFRILLSLYFFFRDQSGSAPQFKKVVFQEFTDGSFTQPLDRGELNEHLGLLGPYIRAEVEDNIMVS
jgi:hypothetical protein